MTTNTYFETIRTTAREWRTACTEREERKREIIKTCGWDSEEMRAWQKEDEAAEFPYTQGACKAFRAWEASVERGEDELEMDDFLWEGEVEDFVAALREAGIQTIVVTNRSTALMENVHWLTAAGWRMEGPCTITRLENRWGEKEGTEVMGIRFTLG